VVERNLEGKVALVTGGAGAIGSATCERFARAGASVAVCDIRKDAAAAVVDRIKAEGGAAEAFAVDLLSEDQIRTLVEAVIGAFGRLDILHNNAAATREGVVNADLTLLTLNTEVWDETFAVNVRAPMLLSKYAIPHMIRQGTGGAIINTSSGASEMPDRDARTAYGPSKAALEVLTRYIAMQHGPDNIRCNAILPGVVLTKGMQKLFTKDALDSMVSKTMLQRVCLPEDIAAMAHFLASDDARQVTGELLRVDGGRP
jgi:NAD(P)-dependent dehydrogenase (short-subunit alcohol dehydrogenase family)